ncbi:MAG TPA: cation diffusion facilitator family transporter [Candidatus Udaeobacter sp.]|nr:cation diffusion facilitator family transporter [Candidatus Udaeobacter sp.]
MSTSAPQRRARIVRVLWGVLALNLMVAAAKLTYGAAIGALALTADGVHSLFDALSNVGALFGIWASRRPPDANHPYGHRKYETFAALGVVAMLLLACWQIGTTAIAHLVHPQLPRITAQGFVVLLLTISVNIVVVAIESREGRRQNSELLLADAAHTRSDVLSTLLVLVSFIAARLGVPHADVVAALLIIVLILHAGYVVLKGTLSTLGDERRIAPALVEACALEELGVREAHNVRSRGPLDDIHLDLHILVDPATPLALAHAIGHRVDRRLRDRFPGVSDVVVHVEPALESERAHAREGGGLRAEG